MGHEQRSTITRNHRRAIWPQPSDRSQPLVQHRSESPGSRVLHTSELLGQSKTAEKWNPFWALRREAAIAQLNKQVEHCRGGRQHLDSFKVGRSRMR